MFENAVCFLTPTLARASAGATSAGCRHVPCQSPILGLRIRWSICIRWWLESWMGRQRVREGTSRLELKSGLKTVCYDAGECRRAPSPPFQPFTLSSHSNCCIRMHTTHGGGMRAIQGLGASEGSWEGRLNFWLKSSLLVSTQFWYGRVSARPAPVESTHLASHLY